MNEKRSTKSIYCQNKPFVRIKNVTTGITLVALVVTVIILLILAGVTITYVLGDNGIIDLAKKAKNEMEEQALIEQEMLESFSYSNKPLWESPFQYQLIGSEEQEKIEEKLGRKLEATDLFYEVINENEEDQNNSQETYIYNKKEYLSIKVDKSLLKRNNAVWYWRSSEASQYFIDQEKRIQMLDFLKGEGITELYIAYESENFEENVDLIKQIAREAYERGMVTEWLTGDPRYISDSNEENIAVRCQTIVNYNKNCEYNEKIRGIHYDVEIHSNTVIDEMPSWGDSNSEEEKNSQRKINYVKFIEKAYKLAQEAGIVVAFDVPPLRYAATTVNYNGEEKSLLEYVVQNSDYISCMAYRNEVIDLFRYICLPSNTEYDKTSGKILYTSNTKAFSDGTIRNNASVHQLALKHKKNIMIGVEIGEAGEKNAFNDMGKTEMKRVLQEFNNLLREKDQDIVVNGNSLKQRSIEKCGYNNVNFDHFGFSYHYHYEYFNMPN